jgi:hypothetical protein
MTKNWEKFSAEKKHNKFFGSKTKIYLSLGFHKGISKLQKKPSALKKEHPALQNMKFLNIFIGTFLDNFCPPGYGSGFRIRIH